ncbi:hypothetical protein DOTSEDRAFT_70175 [Dothistroma septosporum NZE10]|uniref:PSP1 C-terminal domain-containing protein n=1 Tax=Dothistroma septosporum (strain NZE10 / CBS 128990) TaxID=675120 RepID=N1PUQ1_DOTSN|nr:hypothetical protein DOTSEDRAFT_70175 [Dothistroma septosporum NZE10]
MNPARRATPDSEAVASSEDERPWPSSTSFGKFPMRQNSVPGLPGGIWSTTRKGSFKMSEAAQRNAVREARLAAPVHPAHAALRPGNTPSPSASEGASLPFSIPLQPTPKTGRSLSHSQGQREAPQTSGPHASAAGQVAALPLGLLAEEADTESESELGSRLTHTTSHPPIGSLLRTATLPATYAHAGNGRDYDEDQSPPPQTGILRGKTFESAFANFSLLDQPPRRAQWQSHLGWDNVPSVNESRRHSLADIPTRRGSLAGGEPSHLSRAYTHQEAIEDDYQSYDQSMSRSQHAAAETHIPTMYRVPAVHLTDQEQREIEARRNQQQQQITQNVSWGPGGNNRPRKQLYIVSFKCSRVDVFYLLDNTGLTVREGDMVIVEADRGQDLGTVQHAKVTPDHARILKKKYSEEQYKWLMMYSRNKEGGFNPNAQLHGESSMTGGGEQLFPDAPTTMQGTIPRGNFNNLKPKAIKRLANDHEIKMLAEKEGNEAKAKRTCQQKVAHLRLQMEILDAEWQWDFQKLIFYYYADHYINFKDLITELYRIYKTRIWLSAINPASFSQHAMGQPPTGIGPGAVTPQNPYAVNSAYTMSYGEDRDPYGAQMPYQIPYDTYNPNYPAIPGVSNSFAPAALPPAQQLMFYDRGGMMEHAGSDAAQQASEDAQSSSNPYANTGASFSYPMFGLNEQGGPNDYRPGMLAQAYLQNQQAEQAHSMQAPHAMPAFGGQSIPWSPRSQNISHSGVGLGRQAAPPNPIGTARPTSNGDDYGGPSEQPRQSAQGNGRNPPALQFGSTGSATYSFNRNTQTDCANPARDFRANVIDRLEGVRLGEDIDKGDTRAQNLDRYFARLASPEDMRAEEMSRER